MRNASKKQSQRAMGNRKCGPLALTAAVAAVCAAATPRLFAGTTGSAVTISTSGSTALKNWFVANTNTFTVIQPDTQVTIGGSTYPPNMNQWSDNGGDALLYQL